MEFCRDSGRAGGPRSDVSHHRRRIGGQFAVGLDPIDEGEARTPEVCDPQADLDAVVDGDLSAVTQLESRHHEGDRRASAKVLSPEHGARGLHVGHNGGVVDVTERINVAPPELYRHHEREAIHGPDRITSATIQAVPAPVIDDAEVQLWWASCAAAARDLSAQVVLLDLDERQRADRIRVDAARHRFVAARALARHALGHFLESSPKEIRFSYGARGKPLLAHPLPDRPLHFNLAHSGDTAVVAVAREELGVDVEALRPVPNADRLARRYCSADEQRWLADRPQVERGPAFLRLWTCKEAYLKAVGIGVGMPLREVSADPGSSRLRAISGDDEAAARWTLLRVDLPEPAVCTVAVRGSGWQLKLREYRWQSD